MEVTLRKIEEIIVGLEFAHDKGILDNFVPELIIPDEYSDEYVDYARSKNNTKNKVERHESRVPVLPMKVQKSWNEYTDAEIIKAADKQNTVWSDEDKAALEELFNSDSIPHLKKLALDFQRTPDGIERQVWKHPGYAWKKDSWTKRG